ncbi:MAG: hypothetical protein K8I04_05630 [Gammaproteobacteria bacterium]|nr:hypothetical protein [Gammaproteobacteria bacterium]
MSALPPRWAMGASGIDGAGDPHLVDGIHLRVYVAPQLGLPVCPFLVYRVEKEIVQDLVARGTRTGIAWVDAYGRVLTLPFTVTPDNPVTGHLLRNSGEVAIAVSVQGGRNRRTPVLTHRPMETHGTEDALVVAAYVDTTAGRRFIGERTASPYTVAGSHIDGVVISGEGVVRAAAWVAADVRAVEKFKPTSFLALPYESAPRYRGLPFARDTAENRVRRGAPQRLGLHDDPTVASAALAPPATDNDEWTRVEPLTRELEPHLKQLLEDLSTRQHDLGSTVDLDEGVTSGATVATAQLNSLDAVLAGTADPGMARWLGFMDVDLPPADPQPFELYFIRGFLAVDNAKLDVAQLISLLVAGGPMTAPANVLALPFTVPHLSADGLPVYDFTVPLFVVRGAPPARPSAPLVGTPLLPAEQLGATGTTQALPTGDALGTWVPEVLPPAAQREITLPLAGLTAAPTLAVARHDSGTGPIVSLNARHPDSGRALALVPTVPDGATETGSGRYADDSAPPDAVEYRIAQADWWGRWSDWGTRAVAAKPRTRPPAPVLSLEYDLADDSPLDDTPRFGTLRAVLILPRVDDLAAGSRPLVGARVSGTVGGVTVNEEVNLPVVHPAKFPITITPPAGMIARTGSVEARLVAHWFDDDGYGDPSEEQRKVLVDPRPPAALVMDPTLRYSARPDAVGRARVVLSWTGAPNARYRVYTSDETRLRSALAERAGAGDAAAAAVVTAVDAAPDAAHRGAVWSDPAHAAVFTRDLFSNLTDAPLQGTALRYAHDLSGSLRVLAFFKVVALSVQNVESDFTAATLLPVAVPSGGPPPRPLLDLEGFSDEGAARFTATVVRGPQPAARWRLRRSVADSDPLRMPIVAEGDIPAPALDADPATDGPQEIELLDAGTDPFAGGSLPPWTRMTWRVEVQAPPPPGTTLPGEWSPASGAVSSALIPPDPPAAPTGLALVVSGTAATITWRHPERLRRGAMGGYRFDVYRRLPGGRETRVGTVLADDPTASTGTDLARTFHFVDAVGDDPPSGTSWRVVTLDPGGRLSAPSTTVTRS